MQKLLGCLLFVILLVGAASAMPILKAPTLTGAGLAENVKVICEEDGHCYRPPVRRPVARWVYGDNNFVGPYTDPGYYGSPRRRHRWWPFFWGRISRTG